jgi:hypothetical protein
LRTASHHVDEIRRPEPKCITPLKRYRDTFGYKDTRARLALYVQAQLSTFPGKNLEPIASDAGFVPGILHGFLS